MKLEKILDKLNSFEKNSFLKIIDNILVDKPLNAKKIEEILIEGNRDLKSIDNINIAKVFNLVEKEYSDYIKAEFKDSTRQLDILADIIIRDGNSIMKPDWFARLYEAEIKKIHSRLKQFADSLADEKSELDIRRKRDYLIYRACLDTAFKNDQLNNQECKITSDEQSILDTLATELELSLEEVKLIHYLIVPIKKFDIESIIADLKATGIVFFSRKQNTVFIADEVVRLLRKIRGKEVADKFTRRVLRLLREPQINMICRKHNIDWKVPIEEKVKAIISEGVSILSILKEDIYKEGTTLTDRKKIVSELCDKGLQIDPPLKGITLEEKISNLIKFFEIVENEEKVGISHDGYEKLLIDLDQVFPMLNNRLRKEFELQDEKVMTNSYLLDYNIKPRDVLEIMTEEELIEFCTSKEIKKRGDSILNILDAYKDAENLYLENYDNIGFRDLAALKGNGIIIKEADIGQKFEDLTKLIFSNLGFNVDEEIRKDINTAKDKIDIVINIGNGDLILVECKTIKEKGYNKFSHVARQMKSYAKLAETKGFRVIKSILVAPDFSDDFIKECGLEYELNLSLIASSSLVKILNGFKDSKLKQLPYNLLMRDVLIRESMVLKAIDR